MNTVISTLPRAAAAIMFALMLAGTAVAIEWPPVRPEQQRSWLAGRLVADMQGMGMFSGDEIAETVSLVEVLTDEQVGILVRLYCLMRQMAEQDARLVVVEPSETPILLRRRIRRVYWELVAVSPGCRMLCEVTYASIPGWCVLNRYVVPDWYFRGGCYVGPIRSARFGGAYSVLGSCYCLPRSSGVSLREPLPFGQGDMRGFAVVIGLKRSSSRRRLGSGLTMVARQLVANGHFARSGVSSF